MEVDLGSVEDRRGFTFHEILNVPDEGGNTLDCDTTINATVTRVGNRFLLEASVSVVIRVECSRCINGFEMPLDTGFSVILYRGQAPHEVDDDDLVLLAEADESGYDILPRVREAVILELPIRFLCREDCKGLCPRCGANLNEGSCDCESSEGDPRWASLKKLLNNDEKR